jgi:hypothetical protein
MSEFKGTRGKLEMVPTSAININDKPLYYDICIIDPNVGTQSFISTFKNQSIGIDDEIQEANAKLISCAPEMLEMLKDALNVLEINNLEGNLSFNTKQLIQKATTL